MAVGFLHLCTALQRPIWIFTFFAGNLPQPLFRLQGRNHVMGSHDPQYATHLAPCMAGRKCVRLGGWLGTERCRDDGMVMLSLCRLGLPHLVLRCFKRCPCLLQLFSEPCHCCSIFLAQLERCRHPRNILCLRACLFFMLMLQMPRGLCRTSRELSL